MHLYQRTPKGNWHCEFEIRKQRVRRSTGTKKKTEAWSIAVGIREQARREILLGQVDHTFDEACFRWLEERGDKRSIAEDHTIMRWLRDELPEGFMLSDFNPDLIRRLRLAKLKTASKARVNRCMALVRSILYACVNEWEWMDRMVKVPMYRIVQKEPRWLTPEEWQDFYPHLPPDRQLPARFAIATGLRSLPIRSLTWAQIHGDVARVNISQAKNAEPLSIPLNQSAMAVLDECRGRHDAFVFVDDDSKQFRREMVNKAWRRAIAAAGIDHITFHGLRHTWASWHIQNGTPLEVLKELGGWKSLEMVMVYAHLAPATHRKWAENCA